MNFRLQDIRENMELSQKEVADILKVSQPTYSRWEKEVEIIPLNKLILLANYYGISLDYICNLSNIKKESKAYNYKVDKKISWTPTEQDSSAKPKRTPSPPPSVPNTAIGATRSAKPSTMTDCPTTDVPIRNTGK